MTAKEVESLSPTQAFRECSRDYPMRIQATRRRHTTIYHHCTRPQGRLHDLHVAVPERRGKDFRRDLSLGVTFDLTHEPSSGEVNVSYDGNFRNRQPLGDFLVVEPAEVSKFNHLRFTCID